MVGSNASRSTVLLYHNLYNMVGSDIHSFEQIKILRPQITRTEANFRVVYSLLCETARWFLDIALDSLSSKLHHQNKEAAASCRGLCLSKRIFDTFSGGMGQSPHTCPSEDQCLFFSRFSLCASLIVSSSPPNIQILPILIHAAVRAFTTA